MAGPTIRSLANLFENEDVFVVGTGTSLAGFDWSRLAGRRTIALNNAALAFPASIWLFSDPELWKRYRGADLPRETAHVVCREEAAADLRAWPGCRWSERICAFERTPEADRPRADDDLLYVDSTVATGGIMLAWKLGARRILLLGVDAYRTPQASYMDGTRARDRGKTVREERGRGAWIVEEEKHVQWRRQMGELRRALLDRGFRSEPWPGAGVFNLSPRSTIDSWPKVDAREVFP